MSSHIRNLIITAFFLLPVTATAGTDVWTVTGPPGEYIRSIAVAPGSPETIYAGGCYAVYESTDSGSTWLQSGLTVPAQPCIVSHEIVIQP